MNRYNVVLTDIHERSKSIEMNFENHDDIFKIIEFMKQKFANEDEAKLFAIGLKLVSNVMMKNRDNDLFSDFEPAFRNLMKKLKS